MNDSQNKDCQARLLGEVGFWVGVVNAEAHFLHTNSTEHNHPDD